MSLSLEDKLFHSPVSNLEYHWTRQKDLEIILLKIERIFLTRKIMCRSSLRKIEQDNIYYSKRNYNGDHLVSLTKHISQKSKEDEDENHIIFSDENAWELYPWNQVSLVLNKNLLTENKKDLNGTRIPLELQVEGDIDLKYLEAISFPAVGAIQPFFKENYSKEEAAIHYLKTDYHYCKLNSVIELMKKYEISVPLVDIDTGNKYRENLEYRKLLKTLKK